MVPARSMRSADGFEVNVRPSDDAAIRGTDSLVDCISCPEGKRGYHSIKFPNGCQCGQDREIFREAQYAEPIGAGSDGMSTGPRASARFD
ncbi:hypothetical protein SCOR_31840 [Sulfidibacter corallicola]